MREIKFRAWDKEAKIMYPNVQNHIGNFDTAFGNMLRNDRYVIEQFTGLKDKNGKDLDWWEGDLFETIDSTFKIIQDLGCFWFVSVVNNRRILCKDTLYWGELPNKIGTIHDKEQS